MRADELSALIEKLNYGEANEKMLQLDTALRNLSEDDFASLDQTQRNYLLALSNWLTDQNASMQSRKDQMIAAIAPFNKNSSLKTTNHYQDKKR